MRSRWKSGLSIFAIVAIVVLLLAVQLNFDVRWGSQAEASRPPETETVKSPPTSANEVRGPQGEPAISLPLLQRILRESEKISETTNNPAEVERSLNQWATELTPADLKDLRGVAFSKDRSGDEIALALDLLSRSDAPEAQATLTDYVLASPDLPSPEHSTFQLMALEGVIDQSMRSKDPQALRKIQSQSTDALVAQRAAQAEGALQGKNPSPEATDQKALEELLKKSGSH